MERERITNVWTGPLGQEYDKAQLPDGYRAMVVKSGLSETSWFKSWMIGMHIAGELEGVDRQVMLAKFHIGDERRVTVIMKPATGNLIGFVSGVEVEGDEGKGLEIEDVQIQRHTQGWLAMKSSRYLALDKMFWETGEEAGRRECKWMSLMMDKETYEGEVGGYFVSRNWRVERVEDGVKLSMKLGGI